MNKENPIKKETVACYKCRRPFGYYLGANAYTVVCPECGTLYNGYSGTLVRKTETAKKITRLVDIPLGSSGTLKGIKYTVVGLAEKKEKGTLYFWLEYTLFNPIHGYAVLSQYNGHWTYLTGLENFPVEVTYKKSVKHDGIVYDIYSRYKAVTDKATGEFPYNLSLSETPSVEEFVAPPYVISSEKTSDEQVWFIGEYIDPDVIKSAFDLKTITQRVGVGATQPFMAKFRIEAFKKLLVILTVLFGLCHFYFISDSKEELAFSAAYYITDSTNKKEIYTQPFDLKYGTKNVEIKISANVDNNWMYAGVTLVNETTGDLYDVDLDAEYYHGYEDGYAWAEGAGWTSKVVSQIPEGKYYLIIFPDKPGTMKSTRLEVSVTRDVPIFSNLFIILGILGLFPAIYFFRRNSFERKRWYNSNYSPYDDEE